MRGFATPLTASTPLNKTIPPPPTIQPLSTLTGARPDISQQVSEVAIHINKVRSHTRMLPHFQADTHAHKHIRKSLWGPLRESQTWQQMVKGFPGWGKTCNNKDSSARLSHEPRGGRAAPRAAVTNQWLSGLDNAPWMSVIPSLHMFDNML